MDLIDRLRTYASTRKGELAELITEAADALERQTCEDAVSRADVIELVKDSYYNLAESIEDTWAMVADVEALPAAQPLVIHCTDCEDWLERQSILGVTISELPAVQPDAEKYEYHYDHTDCIWYRPEARNRCPTTCAQYRDGWNDAMNYIFRDGKGYRPFKRGVQYDE